MLERYRKINRFRVEFADVDMLRHVNNTTYLRWAETARSEYFYDVLGEEIGGGSGMILGKMEVVYELPMFYREFVALGARVSRIGTKSFDFEHEIWSEDRAARCARITTTMVAMDYATNQSVVVPPVWRERIAAFEPHPT
jgi:acyl-CoA thioester hydrolase